MHVTFDNPDFNRDPLLVVVWAVFSLIVGYCTLRGLWEIISPLVDALRPLANAAADRLCGWMEWWWLLCAWWLAIPVLLLWRGAEALWHWLRR